MGYGFISLVPIINFQFAGEIEEVKIRMKSEAEILQEQRFTEKDWKFLEISLLIGRNLLWTGSTENI